MATRFLNSGNPIVIIAVIIVCTALRAGVFTGEFPQSNIQALPFFYDLLFIELQKSSVLNFISGLLLAIIQGLVFNRMVQEQKLITRISNLPFAVFLLLTSLFPQTALLSPQLVAATFALLALKVLFSNAKSTFSIQKYFQTGLFLGIAGLFEPAALLFLIFPFFNALYFHVQYFRSFTIPLIGFALSYYLAYGFASVIAGRFLFDWQHFLLRPQMGSFTGYFYYASVLFTSLLIGFGFPVLNKLSIETVQVRKVYLLLFWWASICLPVFIFSGMQGLAVFTLAMASIAAMISYLLFYSKRTLISDFIIYGIVVLTFINNWVLW